MQRKVHIEKAGTLSLSVRRLYCGRQHHSALVCVPGVPVPPKLGQNTTHPRNPTLPSIIVSLDLDCRPAFVNSEQVACRCPGYRNLFVRTCLPPMPSLAIALRHHPSLTFMPIPMEPLACMWPTRANGMIPKSRMISGLSATPEKSGGEVSVLQNACVCMADPHTAVTNLQAAL